MSPDHNKPTSGICTDCAHAVISGEGLRRFDPNDGWKFRHRDGYCKRERIVTEFAFTPTAQQQACIDAYVALDDLVVTACAGAGKTSTLRLLAEAAPDRRVLYLAFNKAIVMDVNGSMPKNVTAKTAHSMAFQAIGKYHAHRLRTPKQSRDDVARRFGIDTAMAFKMEDGAPPKMLQPGQLASICRQALLRFCKTADEAPTRKHFPYIDKIDVKNEDGSRQYVNNNLLASTFEYVLLDMWADVNKPDGWLRYEHDHYLKQYQLTHPRMEYSVVMLDEGQDADPVIAAIFDEQTHAQRVVVGDQNQQIYEWRGAVDAMANFDADTRCMLSRSFRFGPAIANVANEILAQLSEPTDMVIEGHPPLASTVGATDAEPDAILCRTNARALHELIDALGAGRRPHLVGGGKEIAAFARGALALQRNGYTDHPDLAMFGSWGECVAFVELDEDGDDIALMVRLIEEFGADKILTKIEQMADEDQADVVISTAHKAKGREWDHVRLASDFVRPNREPDDAEVRLRYVACTRARLHLDNTALASDEPEEEQ